MTVQTGSRSSHLSFERAMMMLSWLVKGEATRNELIDHVRANVDDAYERSPADSFNRDLRLLRTLNFPVRYSRRRGTYRLERLDHPVLQLHLSGEALAALALLKGTFTGLPHEERMGALIQELAARLSADVQRKLHREPLPSLKLAPADPWQFHKQSLAKVEYAIDHHQLVEFRYRSPKRAETAEPKDHRVEPYNLEYRDGHLYFDGYNLKTGYIYPYRVDRILPKSAKVLPDKFVPREKLHQRIALRYRLAPEIARFGASVRFSNHHEARQPDGAVIVTGEAESLFAAMKKLLKYGSGCEVLEPAELVAIVVEEARKMTVLYEKCPGK